MAAEDNARGGARQPGKRAASCPVSLSARRRRRPTTSPRLSSRPSQEAIPPLPWPSPPRAHPQPWLPPPRWPTLVTVGEQLALRLHVPFPSVVTPQVQQALGQLMVAQGSAMQALVGSLMAVVETQASPAGHWTARQRFGAQAAVAGSQNCPCGQKTWAHGSGMH